MQRIFKTCAIYMQIKICWKVLLKIIYFFYENHIPTILWNVLGYILRFFFLAKIPLFFTKYMYLIRTTAFENGIAMRATETKQLRNGVRSQQKTLKHAAGWIRGRSELFGCCIRFKPLSYSEKYPIKLHFSDDVGGGGGGRCGCQSGGPVSLSD